MTLYRGPGGTGSASSDADTTLYQEFLTQAQAARDAALQAETNAELAEANAEAAAAGVADDAAAAEASATAAASSASSAASSASAASTSATNAASSATAAASSASAASTSATNAASSATAAASSASSAATSATNAANSATSASNSASTATTQATNASNSATAAAASETSASTSATNAANSASAASTSASNASNNATAAAGSASSAATSATNAAASAASASGSASTATTQATNAANSATAANTSATSASASATNAANSATAAGTSATNAANSASAAASSATTASNAATTALAAQTAAETAYDNFDDRYLGAKTTAPTVDNDGNTLITGALYFNSNDNQMYVRSSGGTWIATSSTGSGDVVGPVSSTNNAIARFDGTTGKLLKNSTATLSDTGDISVTTVNVNGSSITSTAIGNWNTAFSWGNHASAGYLTSITSSQITTALGYTPYNSTNPTGYITTSDARSALSFTAGSGAYNSTTGVITIPTNTDQLTNGAGYITNAGNARVTVENNGTMIGTRRSINFIPGTGISLSIADDPANEEVDVTITSTATGGVTSFNTRTGAVTLSSSDVTTALGATPVYTTTDQTVGGTKTFSAAPICGPLAGVMAQNDTSASLEIRNNGGTGDSNLAMMRFHATGTYGVKMGLRSDGFFGIGGWSAPSWRWYLNCANGDMIAAGNVTAYSDERLKTDWSPLSSDFVERLSEVKSGTYTRIDTNERQAGSSAQDWQKLLPEVVTTGSNDEKTLSLAYGNAALVACVELAKRVVHLETQIAALVEKNKGI